MLYKEETPLGSIIFSKIVIARIVTVSVKKFHGRVRISNPKGKIPRDYINNIDISMGANGLDVRVYVVIDFGMSIGFVTDSLIEGIYRRIKELTGLEPNSVAIIVTGLVSKKQTARRNIEVMR